MAASPVRPLDPARSVELALRRCFGAFPTGVTLVTYDSPAGPRGATVNSFVSVSMDPPLVLVSIGAQARARTGLADAPFAVNILGAHQADLALHFAGRPREGLRVPWQRGAAVPRLRECAAWLECRPWRAVEAGDHVLFLGEVVAHGRSETTPLLFHAGTFVAHPSTEIEDHPALTHRLHRRRHAEGWSDEGVRSHATGPAQTDPTGEEDR